MNQPLHQDSNIPLVVQLGFAGSRTMFESPVPETEISGLEEELELQLKLRLAALPQELNLSSHHFLCGISQVAVGADTIFTRACRELGLRQRVFLPQPPEEYLNALGSDGTPDFTVSQKATATELLSSPHVIQEQVVSDARERRQRFEDVNREIARVSDVVICLVRQNAEQSAGGTHDLLRRALARGKPVLELRVLLKNGHAEMDAGKWHWPKQDTDEPREFVPPVAPPELRAVSIAPNDSLDIDHYCRVLGAFAKGESGSLRRHFGRAAYIVVGTHIAATICSALALAFHVEGFLLAMLMLEVLLLSYGFRTHYKLHHMHASHRWSTARVVREIVRSIDHLRDVPVAPDYLFVLPFPEPLRPLLETINILHLSRSRIGNDTAWPARRDHYVQNRLLDPERGQIPFYDRRGHDAERSLNWARRTFEVCSLVAIAAALVELCIVLGWLQLPHTVSSLAAVAAISLPVLAVGAQSLATALDF